MDPEQLIESWQIAGRINHYLLNAIANEHLGLQSPAKGRTVGETFAHLHNVRLMWLKVAAPDLMAGLEKLEKEQSSDPEKLRQALEQSDKAIAKLLKMAAANGGKVRGFKPHVTAFLSYMIAHEAHHRGQILMILKAHKVQVDKKILYGLWEWGSR